MKRKYFPKKPANGGIPAKDIIETITEIVINLFFLPKPSKDVKSLDPFTEATFATTVNAAIVATE